MNDYRITFGGPNMETGTVDITERTEDGARRAFKAGYRKIGVAAPDIFDIEIVRENTTATKEQEREALEKIKRMVAELGPQSYLATAFEGCFEDAEGNIENDFGDSMKARWIHADAQLNAANGTIKELKEQLAESEKDYEAAHAANHAIADEKNAEIEALQKKIITPDDLTDIIQLVTDKLSTLEAAIKNATERIVEMATEPESAEFQSAVKDHRAAKDSFGYYTAILERLVKVQMDI